MKPRKPKFKVGQVVVGRLTGYVGKVQAHYHDSSGSDVWWYELVEDATPWAEQELRPLTKRERGGRIESEIFHYTEFI